MTVELFALPKLLPPSEWPKMPPESDIPNIFLQRTALAVLCFVGCQHVIWRLIDQFEHNWQPIPKSWSVLFSTLAGVGAWIAYVFESFFTLQHCPLCSLRHRSRALSYRAIFSACSIHRWCLQLSQTNVAFPTQNSLPHDVETNLKKHMAYGWHTLLKIMGKKSYN